MPPMPPAPTGLASNSNSSSSPTAPTAPAPTTTTKPPILEKNGNESGNGVPYQRLHDDVETTGMKNLFCAWSIGFLTSIESTVSTPSLFLYVKSMGGSRHYYALCIAAFAFGRFSFMGIFGMWADRRPFKEVFQISLLISMASGVLYALAPTVGLWAIPVARLVLGAMSGQSVATQSFVSQNTSQADRTKYMTYNQMVQSSLGMSGPAFNIFIVMLPCFDLPIFGNKLVFNSYTWVGWFLFCFQIACMIFIHTLFTEPAARNWEAAGRSLEGSCAKCATLGGFLPWGRLFTDPWLRKTRSWACFVINMRNQFTVFAVTWIIPVITDRDYGLGQFQNSIIFVAMALESLCSSYLIGLVSEEPLPPEALRKGWRAILDALRNFFRRKLCDRDSLTIFQTISFTGLLAYVVLSNFGNNAIPMPLFIAVLVWYDFGVPASQTQSLYSKLIGPGGNAIYFSVLQSNGAVARLMSAHATNVAVGMYGMSFLFESVFVLWAVQWVIFGVMWKDLHPDAIEKMHDTLGRNPSAPKAKAKGKGKAKAKAKGKDNAIAPTDP